MKSLCMWCDLVPAVDHDGSGVGGRFSFDPPHESQQTCGVIRNAVIRPTGEMKLTDLTDLVSSSLQNGQRLHHQISNITSWSSSSSSDLSFTNEHKLHHHTWAAHIYTLCICWQNRLKSTKTTTTASVELFIKLGIDQKQSTFIKPTYFFLTKPHQNSVNITLKHFPTYYIKFHFQIKKVIQFSHQQAYSCLSIKFSPKV